MKYAAPLLGLACCLALPHLSRGQAKDSLKLQDLAMPTSPAFSLLDQAPTTIDQPTSARALALGLYQSFSQNKGLPTNYAAEFTPFWFVKHPGMSFFRYYGTDAQGQRTVAGPQVLRTSFSLAFVSPANPAAATTTGNQTASFSYGGRFSLLKVVRKTDLDTLRARTARVVTELAGSIDDLNAAVPLAVTNPNEPETNRQIVAYYTARMAQANQKAVYQANKKGIAEILSRKPLASIDVAAAGSRYFPTQTFASNRAGRVGVWLTGSLAAQFDQNAAKNKKGYATLYLIGRLMSDRTLADTTKTASGFYLDINYLDAGGKLELALSNFTLSYELVARNVSGSNQERNPTVGDGWRSVGNVKYKIGSSTYITGAFGRNFGKRDNLLYTLGVNWNISSGNEQASTSQ